MTTSTHLQEIHTIAGAEGDMAAVTAYGFLQATGEASSLFYDPFDGTVIDTTDRWNAAVVSGAGAAVSQAAGSLTLTAGALINSYAYINSKASFNAMIPGFLQPSYLITLEAGTAAALNTNAHRFFGIGTAIAAPTAANPLTNAAGFEIGTDGKMRASVYSNGTRTFTADLSSTGTGIAASTMPFDGAAHRYLVQYRTDRVFFFVDGVQVATSTVSPEVQTLPVRHSWVNSAAIVGTMTYNVQGSVVADTARNATRIADGTFAWRQVRVTDPSSFDAPPVATGQSAGSSLKVDANGIQKRTFVASRVTADAAAPAGVVIVANTRKALLQVHHLAAATTTKRIKRIQVGALFGAAVQYGYEVYRVTAAPGGGAALTPISNDTGDSTASTLTCTYLPAAGTSGAITGIPVAGTTVLGAATGHALITVYEWNPATDQKPLTIRKGVLEGYTLFVRGTGIVGPDPQIFIDFVEE